MDWTVRDAVEIRPMFIPRLVLNFSIFLSIQVWAVSCAPGLCLRFIWPCGQMLLKAIEEELSAGSRGQL